MARSGTGAPSLARRLNTLISADLGTAKGKTVDRTAYESHLKPISTRGLDTSSPPSRPQSRKPSWELGPAGEETQLDLKNAAETLRDVARSLDDVMNAYDNLLESAGRPRQL